MKNLSNLKKRLEALPELRKGIKQRARFKEFLSKATPAKEQLVDTSYGIDYAAPVLPSIEYDVARRSVKSSARIAKNLTEKLRGDANTITDRQTEDSFVKLIDYAKAAIKKATSVWQAEVQAKIAKWETISKVVAAIAEGNPSIREKGDQLKSSVDALLYAKDSLPRSQKDVETVEHKLKQLTEAISNLGLETQFGKFLQDAASDKGALLGDLEDESVAEQIKTLKLTNVFRVRLTA